MRHFDRFDARRVPSPCFVVDEVALEENLQLLAHVQRESGATILLALKAFSMFSMAPLVRRYLAGTCASGLHEARLGREEFGGEVHTFCAAFTEPDLREVLALSDHVVFNSFGQFERFRPLLEEALAARPGLQLGMRVNPRAFRGRGAAVRSLRALLAPRRAALAVSRRPARAAERPAFPHPVRAGFSAAGAHRAGLRAEVRRLHPAHEVDQLRRRPPHHASRLPGRGADPAAGQISARATACRSTSSRARPSPTRAACW